MPRLHLASTIYRCIRSRHNNFSNELCVSQLVTAWLFLVLHDTYGMLAVCVWFVCGFYVFRVLIRCCLFNIKELSSLLFV